MFEFRIYDIIASHRKHINYSFNFFVSVWQISAAMRVYHRVLHTFTQADLLIVNQDHIYIDYIST